MAMPTPSHSPNLASCRAQARCAIFAIVVVVATTWQVLLMMREHGFAARLREWRQRRGWSQLDLAGRADISQRHFTFLELPPPAPPRPILLPLSTSLHIPLPH